MNFGDVAIADVLDVRGFNLNAILEIDPEFLAGEHPDAARGGRDIITVIQMVTARTIITVIIIMTTRLRRLYFNRTGRLIQPSSRTIWAPHSGLRARHASV